MPTAALTRPRVVMGLMFFPRGGSAQVARGLAQVLAGQRWDVTIVSGSLRLPGRPGDAHLFFSGLDVSPVDYTAALSAADPLRADSPLHPSYEDRPGAPDRVFATVDNPTYEHLVASWAQVLRQAGAATADILHLHHLTPLNEAAARVAPDVPVVGHLHGTELLLLEAIASGPPVHWIHAQAWAQRMRRWASACQRLVVPSATQLTRAQGPVLLYLGRFTAVKRLGLLITAYNRAQASFAVPAPLVLLGGFPGEWEGEHPLDTIQRTGARDVFLAGWHDHDELPDIFAASDVVVLPSVREQFGQVLVEGMACGLPAIAVAALGPSEIVEDGQTGWLVPPDDEEALAAALVMAVNDAHERRRRVAAAYAAVRTRYGWPIVGAQLALIYEALLGRFPVI